MKLTVLIFELIFILSTVRGLNISENLGRNKRDNTPAYLILSYKDNNEIKNVYFIRIVSNLASSLTPVYTTNYDTHDYFDQAVNCQLPPLKYHLLPQGLEYATKFQFYHGVHSLSALTLFEYHQTLHGVLDHKYYIDGLPLRHINNIEIVQNYIRPIPNDIVPRVEKIKNNMEVDLMGESSAQDCPKDNNKLSKYQTILYPELLIGVENQSPIPIDRHELKKVYMYVVSYWNAVDMMIKQLKTIDIRINIAAIVIGTDSLSYPFIHENRGHTDKDGHITVYRNKAIQGLGRHFFKFLNVLQRDSFDFLIFMSKSRLIDKNDNTPTSASVRTPTVCGGLYEYELNRKSIANRALFVHNDKFGEYQTAARVITSLMNTPDNDNAISHYHDSCGISKDMWNNCCEAQLQNYARSGHGCCLLNYPRSLPLSNPRVILTKEQQCRCYGLEAINEPIPPPYEMIMSIFSVCTKPLECHNNYGIRVQAAEKPLDGTPCDEDKYCHGYYCI